MQVGKKFLTAKTKLNPNVSGYLINQMHYFVRHGNDDIFFGIAGRLNPDVIVWLIINIKTLYRSGNTDVFFEF